MSLSSELGCLVTSLAGSLSVNLSPLVLRGFPLHCETYLVVQSTGPSLGVQAEQKMGKSFYQVSRAYLLVSPHRGR